MSKKKLRNRNATVAEIASRLRSAGDYLGAIMGHESAAAAAATGAQQDLEAVAEAHRLLARDLQAFVSASRTAWNYMVQAANEAGCKNWLDQRLEDDPLCRFHREVANQDAHHHEVVLGVNQTVRFEAEAETPVVLGPSGPLPFKMTITGFAGVTYHYNPKELAPPAADLYERVVDVYGKKTVVELALRYFDKLQATLKAAERRDRFVVKSTS